MKSLFAAAIVVALILLYMQLVEFLGVWIVLLLFLWFVFSCTGWFDGDDDGKENEDDTLEARQMDKDENNREDETTSDIETPEAIVLYGDVIKITKDEG